MSILWLEFVIGLLLSNLVIGQSGRSQLAKELGLSGFEIGAKAGDPKSEKSIKEYDEMDTDLLFETAILSQESSKITFEADMADIISQCETQPPSANAEFVQVQGTQFTYQGSPFYFLGMNSYHLTNIELNLQSIDPQGVENTFKQAQELGLQVVRLWAFSENLRTSPTGWNEATFKALDSIIAKAKQNDVKLVLALMNYWEQFNGTDSQVSMIYNTIRGKSIEDFFSDEDVKLLYKSQACKIINRDNTVTGIKYRDDPTIMAWDLMNEARCINCKGRNQHAGQLGGLIGEWMDEMSAFVKSLDPNHLVTSGSEGFFGRQSSMKVLNDNPGSWAQCTGDDFVLINDSPNIDYATVHVYPEHKSWNFVKDEPCDMECILDWVVVYLKAHFEEAKNALGKPVIIEEFGLSTKLKREFLNSRGKIDEVQFTFQERLDFFKRVLGIFLQSAQNGDTCGGVMLWTGAIDSYTDFDGFTVYIDEPGLFFETTSAVKVRQVNLLQKFRKTNELEPCSIAEYDSGFDPNTITTIPPFVILQGNTVVEVIRQAYAELLSYGVITNFGTSPPARVPAKSPSPKPSIIQVDYVPEPQTPPPITSIFSTIPPLDLLGVDSADKCNRMEASVIEGNTVNIVLQSSFEDCCQACEDNVECNAFFFCEKQTGCFDRFTFIPYRSCDLLFSQQLGDGQQPKMEYQGTETDLVSGYL